MNIHIDGKLPIAIAVIDGQRPLSLKDVRMRAITLKESLDFQLKLKPTDYFVYAELCYQTVLVEYKNIAPEGEEPVLEEFKCHALAYETLMAASKQNADYLEHLKQQLDAKEAAES